MQATETVSLALALILSLCAAAMTSNTANRIWISDYIVAAFVPAMADTGQVALVDDPGNPLIVSQMLPASRLPRH